MASSTSVLYIEDLLVEIKEKKLLEVNDVKIPKSKITCVFGMSGAGKSTFLRALVSLIPGTSTIYYYDDEKKINTTNIEIDKLRQMITYLPQLPSMFPGTVRDNIVLSRKFVNLETGEKELEELMGLVNLDLDILNQSAESLSGGEKQRVALARVLSINPSILLLDEPTASLDPISRNSFDNRIRKLLELKPELTIIIITHSMEQAIKLADHLILLNKGKIGKQGDFNSFFNSRKEAQTLLKSKTEAEILDKLIQEAL